MSIALRPSTEADVAAIARVGGAAFDPATDAIVRTLFPAHLQPEGTSVEELQSRWLTRRITAAMGNPDAVLMVAVEGADIVGASLWIAPHVEEDAARPPRVPPPNMNSEAAAEVRNTLGRVAEELFGHGGASNAWELDFLAVDPSHQRRGIGKSLLSWGIEKATQESKDCYTVASASGRPLYIAGGFEEVRQLEICGVPHTQMIIKNESKWRTTG